MNGNGLESNLSNNYSQELFITALVCDMWGRAYIPLAFLIILVLLLCDIMKQGCNNDL